MTRHLIFLALALGVHQAFGQNALAVEPQIIFERKVAEVAALQDSPIPSLAEIASTFGSQFTPLILADQGNLRIAVLRSPSGLIYLLAAIRKSDDKGASPQTLVDDFLDASGRVIRSGYPLGQALPNPNSVVLKLVHHLPDGQGVYSSTGDFGFSVHKMNLPPENCRFVRLSYRPPPNLAHAMPLTFVIPVSTFTGADERSK